MKILITALDRRLYQPLAAALDPEHEIIVADENLNLLDPEEVTPALEGVDALIHSTSSPITPLDSTSEEAQIQWASQAPYVLLRACLNHGVDRAILVSTLDSFDAYAGLHNIDETWRPRPRAEAAALAPVLSERVFREFARQEPITTICLRFGDLDAPDGTPVDLAVQALVRALQMPLTPNGYRWWLYHVVTSERFPMRAALNEPLNLEVNV